MHLRPLIIKYIAKCEIYISMINYCRIKLSGKQSETVLHKSVKVAVTKHINWKYLINIRAKGIQSK